MNVDQGHLLTDLPPDEEHAPRRRITVEDLRTRHDEIVAIGRRYGVSIFGSSARLLAGRPTSTATSTS
jgi:hypothetical protein